MKTLIHGLTSISLALMAFTSFTVNAGTNPHLGQIMMVAPKAGLRLTDSFCL